MHLLPSRIIVVKRQNSRAYPYFEGDFAHLIVRSVMPTRSAAKASSVAEKSNVSLNPKISRENSESIEISNYEKVRLENIRRNEMFLAELGVASMKQEAVASTRPPISGKARAKKPATPTPIVPVRRSSRVTSEKLTSEIKALQEAGKADEAEAKQKELDDLLATKAASQSFAEEYLAGNSSSDRYERLTEAVPLATTPNGDEVDVSQIRDAFYAARDDLQRKAPQPSLSDGAFAALSLHPDDVVKLTPQRMTSVALHPSASKLLAAGGDKTGALTLWDVDHADKAEGGGIYQYKPHVSNVTKLDFRPTSLLSTSYDGTLRLLDLQHDVFSLLFTSPESLSDMYFTDSCYTQRGREDTLLIAKSDGHLALVDTRASSSVYQFDLQLYDSKIAAVDVHPIDEHVILTASSKSGIALHDLRRAKTTKSGASWKPTCHITPHSKSINGVQFAPSGDHFVSVSLDDTIKTWAYNQGDVHQAAAFTIRHNNFTGRWLSTFKPAFDPKRPATFAMGSMLQPRRIEIYSIQSTAAAKAKTFTVNLEANLSGEYLASVNSRLAFHPTINAVLGSNSSGKVHLFR